MLGRSDYQPNTLFRRVIDRGYFGMGSAPKAQKDYNLTWKLASRAVNPIPSMPLGEIAQKHLGDDHVVVELQIPILVDHHFARWGSLHGDQGLDGARTLLRYRG
jgi:hypothetical protein